MPSIWIANTEEVAHPDDRDFETTFVPKVAQIAPRFLLYAGPEDYVIVPTGKKGLPPEFVQYIRDTGARAQASFKIIEIKKFTKPYSIIDSILADQKLCETLKKLNNTGNWTLEPYIQSEKVLALSETLGIRLGQTSGEILSSGICRRLNDKWEFKTLGAGLGIEVIPGERVTDSDSLKVALQKFSGGTNGKVIVKKPLCGGGLGNAIGNPKDLYRRCKPWLKALPLIIEPLLPFHQTIGSLVRIGEDAKFIGLDTQITHDGKWIGFRTPCADTTAKDKITEGSLRMAETLKNQGVRGYLNIDWGIVRGSDGQDRPIAIECNFRHNGFSQILDYATRYFRLPSEAISILYLEDFPLRETNLTFADLASRMDEIRFEGAPVLIHKPGQDEGALIAIPPRNDRCSVAIFGHTPERVDLIHSKLKEALS